MATRLRFAIIAFFLIDILYFVWYLLKDSKFPLLQPAGVIAQSQTNLILMSFALAAIIGIFVLGLLFFVAWHYREGNRKAKYRPDWEFDKKIHIFRWAFPGVIILFFCVITWHYAHALDPFKPLESPKKPLTIQVVALQWKWLFIYPEQRIATVNFIAFPAHTPVTFELTADAPMNSFWIPQLGGQQYAMEGMVNKIHLMASRVGEFDGSDAEISGTGFAGMRFVAKATTDEDFTSWVHSLQQSPQLTWEDYRALAKPSSYVKPAYYVLGDENLYNKIIDQFMRPPSSVDEGQTKGSGHSSMENSDGHVQGLHD